MGPWKKFLSKSANLGKYEKGEKQKYKQYVKIEKQSAQLRSKPESEVYEDSQLARSRSSRRSSKKSKAPAPHTIKNTIENTIENAYEIIEGPSPNNVVVINDDLRNRFAGYEPPKTHDSLYVVVQPREAEVAKPTRLRWKIPLPEPPETPTSPPQEKTNPKTKPKEVLRVPEDDQQDTSISEVFYDCYSEILTEDLKESRHLNQAETNNTKTDPNYDSTSEGSLTRSYDVEYADYNTYADYYHEDQRVYNRYAGEDLSPEDDESRWQPSNIRFCEMSGDEEEQQIYGPFGTFEVANYENALNSRIQMVLDSERYSVMLSLEDQRKEEAADRVDGVEGFTFTYLDSNEDSFGAAGAFEMEEEDEEVLVEAKNIALIDDLEPPKKDENFGSAVPFNLYEEVREDTRGAKKVGEPTPSNLRDEITNKIVDDPTPSNLREGIHEEPRRAHFLKKPIHKVVGEQSSSNPHEEIHEEPKGERNVAHRFQVPTDQIVGDPTSSNLRQDIHEEPKGAHYLKRPIHKVVGEQSPSDLHEEIHEEPKGARNVTHHLEVPSDKIPSNLRQDIHEEPKRGHYLKRAIHKVVGEQSPSDLHEEIHEEPKGARNIAHRLLVPTDKIADDPTPSNLREDIHEEPKAENFAHHLEVHSHKVIGVPTPFNLREIHEEPNGARNVAHRLLVPTDRIVGDPTPSNLREDIHEEPKTENITHHLEVPNHKIVAGPTSSNLHEEINEEPKGARNVAHHLEVPTTSNLLPQEDYEKVQKAKDVEHHLSPPIPTKLPDNNEANIKKEGKNDGAKQETIPTLPQAPPPSEKEDLEQILQVEAETRKNPQLSSSSFRLTDNYSAFFKDPMSVMALRLNSSSKTKPNVATKRKIFENLQYNRPTPNEESSTHLKKSLDPKMTLQSSLRSHSKTMQDVPKPNETTQPKEKGEANQNLQFHRSTTKDESPPRLKKSLDPKMTPQTSLRSSSKMLQDDPKPNGSTQRKEKGKADENLQFNQSTPEEKAPPLHPMHQLHLGSFSKILQDDPKPNGSTQRKEKGKADENLQFNQSTPDEKKPPLHPRPPLRLGSSSKIKEDDPEPDETTQGEEDDDAYENFQFKRATRIEEKSPQSAPGYYKSPVAQPRLSLSNLKRSRPPPRQAKHDVESPKRKEERGSSELDGKALYQRENKFEPPKNKEERGNSILDGKDLYQIGNEFESPKNKEERGKLDGKALCQPENDFKPPENKEGKESSGPEGKAQPQNANSDLFNGLPVESEELERSNQQDQNKGNAGYELFNGLPGTRQEILDANKERNLKIPWDTKPKMSPTFTYFITSKEEEVQVVQSIKPIEGTDAFFNKAKEKRVPGEVLKNPRESNAEIPPTYEDTSIFFDNRKEGEIPWGTRPRLSPVNTFIPFSKTPEEELVNPKKPEQVREEISPDTIPTPTLPKASGDVQNVDDHEHVNINRDSETPVDVNLDVKIPWGTRPKNLEQNKQSPAGVTNFNFDDDVIAVSLNEFQFEEKTITPQKLGENSPSPKSVRNKDINPNTFLPLTEEDGPKELGNDVSKLRDLTRHENTLGGTNFSDEASRLNPDSPNFDSGKSISENFIGGVARSPSLKQKTWHVDLLEKYEGPNLNHHENEARHQLMNLTKEGQPNFTTIVDDKAERVGTQNEANILEGNYQILRGFDVAKEEGIIYHNVHNASDTPQRPFKKPKIPKKVSFRISETPDVSDETPPNIYVPAHSPTEKIGLIQKSAKLEAYTRKLEKTPTLQHSTSLTEVKKPKPNFLTFPRSTSHIQSLPKHNDLERLQQVLSGINDLASIQEQVSAIEDVSNKVKERVEKFDRSVAENEYSELLQILFKSVRIATVLECGFDSDLLDRQQTVLDEIRSSIATLTSK